MELEQFDIARDCLLANPSRLLRGPEPLIDPDREARKAGNAVDSLRDVSATLSSFLWTSGRVAPYNQRRRCPGPGRSAANHRPSEARW